MYTVTINGVIKDQKVHEFKLSVNRLMGVLMPACDEYNLTQDITSKNHFYLRISWLTKDLRDRFIKSEDYRHLISLYNILGVLENQSLGETTSITV
jgi:hypothetical protein